METILNVSEEVFLATPMEPSNRTALITQWRRLYPRVSSNIQKMLDEAVGRLPDSSDCEESVLTLHELSATSGYAEGTITDLTHRGIIPKARNGLYTKTALTLLMHYKHLMSTNRDKEWALARMIERRTELGH